MITRLTLRNFKSVGEQHYDFTNFDLLVGRNNSGKSSVLQALAIWQYCVDEFRRAKRSGSSGIQIVLPNFTALPVPEFNLLWKDRTERAYPLGDAGKKKQEFILIEIVVTWRRANDVTQDFGVSLRYQSPQTIYAIPAGGWPAFRACEAAGDLPKIAYVPPFSGLEPTERWLDLGPIRQQVGKGQPGSVLRNLLLRVWRPEPEEGATTPRKPAITNADNPDWNDLVAVVKRWFAVDLIAPRYEPGKDVHIDVEYKQSGKYYDLIAGGSGFHQTMTLLAFLYGYQPTTILLDEPDAHLHVNLQRELLEHFKTQATAKGVQFLIATHAEEFAKGVDARQIVSLLRQKPSRIESSPAVIRAMADVSNEEITRLVGAPYLVYVEGESDERMLRAWAAQCGAQGAMSKLCFKVMGGGNKPEMKRLADEHFEAIKQIVHDVKRLMIFDFDSAEQAFHPPPDNPSLFEWHRKNIENYLLVPSAWERVALHALGVKSEDLFTQPVTRRIREFFVGQNLTLPAGRTWRNVSANIFQVVDGKRILFEQNESLFHTLRNGVPTVSVLREGVASVMLAEEIHDDVHALFRKIDDLVK